MATARTLQPPSICSCGCAGKQSFDVSDSKLWPPIKILYWQEVPSQIKVEDDQDEVNLALARDKFQERIDMLAAAARACRRRRLPGPVELERRDEEREGSAQEVPTRCKPNSKPGRGW